MWETDEVDCWGVALEGNQSDTLAESNDRPRRSVILHVLPQDLNRGAQVYAGKLRDTLWAERTQQHLVVTLFEGPAGGARPDIDLAVPSTLMRRLVDPLAMIRGSSQK